MNEVISTILQNSSYVTWPVATVLSVYFMKPVWSALAAKLRNEDDRVDSLVKFQHTAETNHFTDLERLIQSDKDQWEVIKGMRKDLEQQGRDIAFIKGKIGSI